MSSSVDPSPGARGGERRRLTRVRKRDGREVPFDVSKIAAAVLKATAAAGEAEERYAREVASLVELALLQENRTRSAPRGAGEPRSGATGDYVPSIEEIQDLVERVLVETGKASVAKAYILYRDQRQRVREAVSVENVNLSGEVRVRDAGGTSDWSKGRIVAALMTEAELSRGSAEEVASAVENKVFDSGLSRITTGLVRELVDIELVSRGWTTALLRQEPVSVPRHDLRRVLAGLPFRTWEEEAWRLGDSSSTNSPAPWPAQLGDRIEGPVSGEVLTRFTLREILDEPTAEMHLSGDFHIEDLGRPHLPLLISIRSELVARGEPSSGAAFALLEELATLTSECAYGVVLEDPGSVLQPLVRGTRAKSPLGLAAWLRSASAIARASRRRIDLGSPGERFSAFTARLVEELALSSSNGPFAPRLFLDSEECLALVRESVEVADAVRRLCAEGRIILTWSGESERFAAPGCRRFGREQGALAASGAVALNLPRLAKQAGPWREDSLFELLSGSVQCALAAARSIESARSKWQRKTSVRTRGTWSIVPIGLRETLRFLGDGEIDPEQGARLVGFLDEATRRFAAEHGLSAVISPFFGERARMRLASADYDRARQADSNQGELFAVDNLRREAPYSTGFGLSPVFGRQPGEAEAELVTTLPSGALFPAPDSSTAGQTAPADGRAPWETWARCHLRRNKLDRDLLFPKAPPAGGAAPTGQSSTGLSSTGHPTTTNPVRS